MSLTSEFDRKGHSLRANELTLSEKKSRVFRIELWNEEIRVIDRIEGAFAQYRTLDPFVSRLLQDGHEGEVVLVDDETGEIIARRKVSRTHLARPHWR
jgi:hypothetical protein